MPRSPYTGSSRSLAIAFDVGTTFSGISYALLDPGEVPKITTVTRFPGQEQLVGSSKIPSVLYYDSLGKLRAAGAETCLVENVELAEDERWTRVEWFKLRLCPQKMPRELQTSLPRLPANKAVVNIFADFLSYLLRCAQQFIEESSPTGPHVWKSVRDTIDFVISHPNGWEGPQQTKLRKAAIAASLIPDSPEGRSRVHFVTEGEASLHFCLANGMLIEAQEDAFIVADLGGGTLDFGAYKLIDTNPLRVEEVASSKCTLDGSTFVTLRAINMIKSKLAKSVYGTDEQVKSIASCFDTTSKRTFRSAEDTCCVKFGSLGDKDVDAGIRAGQLRLSGNEVAPLFEPSLNSALGAIDAQCKESGYTVKSVYLVGGFCASPYIVKELKKRLSDLGISVGVPDGHTSKAVADGSVIFYLDSCVSSRISRLTYGVLCSRGFNALDPEHIRRAYQSYTLPSGTKMVSGGFDTILKGGTLIRAEEEFSSPYFREVEQKRDLGIIESTIYSYSGIGEPPIWQDQVATPGALKPAVRIWAHPERLKQILRKRKTADGTAYWTVNYKIIINFGLAELKAQISWQEHGVECRSPAEVFFEDRPDEEDDVDDEIDDVIHVVEDLGFDDVRSKDVNDGFGTPSSGPRDLGDPSAEWQVVPT